MSQATKKNRLYVLAGAVTLAILLVIFRLYMVQVVHGDEFRERAAAQYTRSTGSINDRGSISLTEKDGSRRTAALQESGYLMAVNGRQLGNAGAAYDQLRTVVDLDQEAFLNQVTDTDDPYIVVKEKLSTDTGEAIRDLQIHGVGVYPQKWRRYPLDSLAAHVIGFVGFPPEGDVKTGIYGTEKYHNTVLQRNPGGFYVNFFARAFSADTADEVGTSNRAGDVNLTLEPDVQAYLEKQLQDVREEWGATQTMGVVIDPNTGDIQAMAVAPDFNPGTYNTVDNTEVFSNPIVQSRYEMGSVVKALTMAAGLDAGVVTPDTTYDDTGTVTLNEATIANYDGVGRGVVDMQTVLNQSLNTGATFVSQQLGQKAMRGYFSDWFSEQTGIDLPSEIANDISNLKVDRELEFATASFGQGIALTPIATIQALSTLANGGQLVQPHVTDSIDYRLGGNQSIQPDSGQRVISEETSDTISRMLATVVDEALQGGDTARDRHSIAAKTGTAQIPKPGGGYYEDRYNHTFFGYFPAYNPEYLVFLMAREPKGVRYASQTLADPFLKITDFLINYYNVPPDR